MRTVHRIKDTTGVLIAEHVRVDWPGGKKRMYWQIPGCDPRDGLGGLSTPDLPLYGSEDVLSWPVGETIVLTEGERARDRLWALGIPSLATVTGASATPGEDALSVLLPFDVVLWPDHDREGYQHFNRVAHKIVRLGGSLPRYVGACHVRRDGTTLHIIAPKGFDAADCKKDGAIERLVRTAKSWPLHAEAPPRQIRPSRPSYDRFGDEDRVQTAKSHLLRVVEEKLGSPKEWRQGTPWWCCPFHSDRSPSFKVDMREPFYRCFGCPARGDVFTFLREIEGVAFKDAIRELAPEPAIRTVAVWSL